MRPCRIVSDRCRNTQYTQSVVNRDARVCTTTASKSRFENPRSARAYNPHRGRLKKNFIFLTSAGPPKDFWYNCALLVLQILGHRVQMTYYIGWNNTISIFFFEIGGLVWRTRITGFSTHFSVGFNRPNVCAAVYGTPRLDFLQGRRVKKNVTALWNSRKAFISTPTNVV